jgi:hypothetical protein
VLLILLMLEWQRAPLVCEDPEFWLHEKCVDYEMFLVNYYGNLTSELAISVANGLFTLSFFTDLYELVYLSLFSFCFISFINNCRCMQLLGFFWK